MLKGFVLFSRKLQNIPDFRKPFGNRIRMYGVGCNGCNKGLGRLEGKEDKMETIRAKTTDKIIAQAIRKLKNFSKKSTLFRIPGEGKLGEWRTIKSPYSPEVAKFIRDKYPTAIIASEDFEAAAKDWTLVNENGIDG